MYSSGDEFLNDYRQWNGASLERLLETIDLVPPTNEEIKEILKVAIEMRDYLSFHKRCEQEWGEYTADLFDRLAEDESVDFD